MQPPSVLRRVLVAAASLVASAAPGACADGGAPAADLTVVTFNACGNVCAQGGPAPAAFVARLARRTGASILLLQEVCRSQADEVGRRLRAEVHHVSTLTDDAGGRNRCIHDDYGIAVVTTAAVERRFDLPLPNPGLDGGPLEKRRIACVDIAGLTACSTHLAPPSTDPRAHRAQVAAVVEAARGALGTGPAVVGGDLNTGRTAFRGLDGTYVSGPVDEGAIDRVFATRDRYQVVGGSSHRCRCSDHRARVIRLARSGSVT